MDEETIKLLKAAYAAGYQRACNELAGWEPSNDDPDNPLGFDEWLAEQM
jgi:hypothetical protein